jgi:hypothetical protein
MEVGLVGPVSGTGTEMGGRSHMPPPKCGRGAVQISYALGVTRPPAQGGSAGAVDTALATRPGYGYAAYLRHFVISTYCAFGHQGSSGTVTGKG